MDPLTPLTLIYDSVRLPIIGCLSRDIVTRAVVGDRCKSYNNVKINFVFKHCLGINNL